MRIITIICFLCLVQLGSTQVSFNILDELSDWNLELTGEPNSKVLISQEKRKNVLDSRKRIDSLVIEYSNEGLISKLEIANYGVMSPTFTIYIVNELGLIDKKTIFRKNKSSKYKEFVNTYKVKKVFQENHDRIGTFASVYELDSNGNVIEEWENHKDTLCLTRKFIYDNKNRFREELIYRKRKVERDKSDRKNWKIVDRDLGPELEEPMKRLRFEYYTNYDTLIIEIFEHERLKYREKKWNSEFKSYYTKSQYSSIGQKTLFNESKETGRIEGVSKETYIMTTEEISETIIKEYSFLDDFKLDKAISISIKPNGSGVIQSANKELLDCRNDELKKVLIEESITTSSDGNIIEKTIKHNDDIVYSMKIEQFK